MADAVHKGAYDIVQVHNFAQLVPFILDKCPSVKVHLHMHCEWLSQLNTGLVEQGVAASTWLSGCSQFIADGIAHRFPNRSEDIFALLNGVDTNLFHPCAEEDHKSVDPVELLFVGRVSPEKGVHVLLHAFNKVVEIEANVRLKIIGARIGAPYDYIARLDSDKKVHELDRYFRDDRLYQSTLDQIPSQLARERIEFIPSVPQAELLNAYQSADVFIFPSVWQEPFGMPLIEAMACGKPVVTTNSGGIPEFVKAGINGLLVERGNAEELADAILSLISDPDTRRRMGIAGREFVERELDWSAVARRLLVQLGASQIPG
ncbi:MAG: glycosyltransferase family 4 protein [Pseudomonadales bacterium]